MKYNYMGVPDSISISSIIENNYTLSCSQYKQLVMKNKNFKYVRDFLSRPLKRSDLGKEIGSINYIRKSPYYFIRTKALQRHTYLPEITDETIVPIMPSAFESSHLKEGDILISKDSNIGEIVILDKDYPNYMVSGAIYKLPVKEHKYYLLASIKHNIFRQQLDFMVPKGATIRHAKTLFLDCKIPIPNKNTSQTIQYVEKLMQAVINKEKYIKSKHESIIKLITEELKNNQKPTKFTYEFPKIDEIQKVGRLDTARYTRKFKEFDFLLRNYVHGSSNLTELGYKKPKRGQNLQVSSIGKSFYSKEEKGSFYKLILSSNFSEYSTVEEFEFLGNPNQLSTINKGDIVFSARGAQFGRCVIFPEKVTRTITNIDSLVIEFNGNLLLSIFITMMLNYYRNNKHIYGIAIKGSGANSLTQYQADDILFPNFPEYKQEEIAIKYHNPNCNYSNIEINLDNFLEEDNKFNKTAGIYDLNKSIKQIKERINQVIDDIANDKDIDISFNFLKQHRQL